MIDLPTRRPGPPPPAAANPIPTIDPFSWEIDDQGGQVRLDFSGGSSALNVTVVLDPDIARALAANLEEWADLAEEGT